MGTFCNNCKQEVKPKSYTSLDIYRLFGIIIFPIIFGVLGDRLFDSDMALVIGVTIGLLVGIIVFIWTLYKMALGNTKICPICKDSNFNNVEHKKFMFAVYFNTHNKHVMIHKNNIHKLEIHGGTHNYDQGAWKYFAVEDEAKSYAENIHQSKALPKPTYCQICYPS